MAASSMFTESRELMISGGEFNVVGRDMTTITTTSNQGPSPYAALHSNTSGPDVQRAGESNVVSRDQVNVTVVNVLSSDSVSNAQPLSPRPSTSEKSSQPQFVSLFDIMETDDDPDSWQRPETNTSSSVSSSTSRRDFTWSGSSIGMSKPSMSTTMTSLQDSQSYHPLSPSTENSSSSELYTLLMIQKGQGFPLWSPTPSLSLPSIYRKIGVIIGDLGLITPDGAFDFLFNVCLPRDYPVNPDDLFEDFEPMQPLDERDIDHRLQFDEGSYLSSGGIYPSLTGADDTDTHSFHHNSKEGALLVFPDGCHSTDARNKSAFLKYAEANAEKWYQYANGPRARDTKNNSLYLVTGCAKAKSWGMAVVEGAKTRTPALPLRLRTQRDGFLWRPSGRASARAYPKPLHPVYNNTERDDQPNQCLFLRGYRIALQEETWTKLFNPSVHQVEDETDDVNRDNDEPAHRPKKRSWASKLFKRKKGNKNDSNGDCQKEHVAAPVCTLDAKELHRHDAQRLDALHPSYIINQNLLEMYPDCRVALTHDDDWCALNRDEADINYNQLLMELRKTDNIMNENGAVSLIPNRINSNRSGSHSEAYSNCRRGSKSATVTPSEEVNVQYSHGRVAMNVTFMS